MDLNLYVQTTLYLAINLVIIFLIYLFVSYLKVNKQKKQFSTLHQDLKKGQEVLLTSGLYGKIKKLDNEVVQVEIANEIIVKVSRFSIQRIESK